MERKKKEHLYQQQKHDPIFDFILLFGLLHTPQRGLKRNNTLQTADKLLHLVHMQSKDYTHRIWLCSTTPYIANHSH